MYFSVPGNWHPRLPLTIPPPPTLSPQGLRLNIVLEAASLWRVRLCAQRTIKVGKKKKTLIPSPVLKRKNKTPGNDRRRLLERSKCGLPSWSPNIPVTRSKESLLPGTDYHDPFMSPRSFWDTQTPTSHSTSTCWAKLDSFCWFCWSCWADDPADKGVWAPIHSFMESEP